MGRFIFLVSKSSGFSCKHFVAKDANVATTSFIRYLIFALFTMRLLRHVLRTVLAYVQNAPGILVRPLRQKLFSRCQNAYVHLRVVYALEINSRVSVFILIISPGVKYSGTCITSPVVNVAGLVRAEEDAAFIAGAHSLISSVIVVGNSTPSNSPSLISALKPSRPS